LFLATFLFSTFQLTPVTIPLELASQQPPHCALSIVGLFSEDYILYHSFQEWIALGEVKWCRELTDGKQGRYGIGVRYHPN